MPLCAKCQQKEATIHFVHKAGDDEKVNVWLCEGCARPLTVRLEASRQGQQKCEFCGEAAFSPLPGIRSIIYACCGCRAEYARMFFERCAAERPDLIQRSRRDVSYFDMCFDPQVEAWSDVEGSDVVRKLKLDRQQTTGRDIIAPFLRARKVRLPASCGLLFHESLIAKNRARGE